MVSAVPGARRLVDFLNEGVAGEGRNLAKEVVRLILPLGYGTVNRCIVLCLKKQMNSAFMSRLNRAESLSCCCLVVLVRKRACYMTLHMAY